MVNFVKIVYGKACFPCSKFCNVCANSLTCTICSIGKVKIKNYCYEIISL